jgi:ribosome-associated protein
MTGPTRDSSTAELARYAVDLASEKLASDIALLDLRGVSDFTEYFVIASGETARHLESLAEDLARALRDSGVHLHHREGTGHGGWILLDFPGLVVHLFTRQVRERYGLERLWGRVPEIVRVQ